MEQVKKAISNAQKAAQKKYDQKTKMVSIKYTLSNMDEYQRLKNYIDRTGQSMNKFIKSLINNFFESGQDQIFSENRVKTPIEERTEIQKKYYPYCEVYYDDYSDFRFIPILTQTNQKIQCFSCFPVGLC